MTKKTKTPARRQIAVSNGMAGDWSVPRRANQPSGVPVRVARKGRRRCALRPCQAMPAPQRREPAPATDPGKQAGLAEVLIDRLPATTLLHGDKGYDSDAARRKIETMGVAPNIPPKSNRRWKPLRGYRRAGSRRRHYDGVGDWAPARSPALPNLTASRCPAWWLGGSTVMPARIVPRT